MNSNGARPHRIHIIAYCYIAFISLDGFVKRIFWFELGHRYTSFDGTKLYFILLFPFIQLFMPKSVCHILWHKCIAVGSMEKWYSIWLFVILSSMWLFLTTIFGCFYSHALDCIHSIRLCVCVFPNTWPNSSIEVHRSCESLFFTSIQNIKQFFLHVCWWYSLYRCFGFIGKFP